MPDSRIELLRQAVLAMKEGRFDVELPTGGDDEVSRLVSDFNELRRIVNRRHQETQKLFSIAEKVNSGVLLDEILDHIYESFHTVIPYNRIGLALLENDGETVNARWARSDSKETCLGSDYRAPLSESLRALFQSGQPRILNDLEAYLAENPQSESTRKIVAEGMRSSLTCPLIARGRPVGFLFFSSRQPNTYRNMHSGIFQQIAGQLAAIVEKGWLYQQLLELNDVKNRFLGMAVHDLRNPITVLKGYINAFQEHVFGEIPPQQDVILTRMERACEAMLHLINDILDVSAIESGHLRVTMERVSLEENLKE